MIALRILIIEDEKHLALPLAAMLREKNYEAECVHNGRDGLDYALSGSYEAIILDVMLPQLNGLEVLEQLRAQGVATPVLMLTALGEDENVVTGLDKGADDYLTKPFSSTVLMARLRSITRRKGQPITRDGALFCGNTSLDVPELRLFTQDGRTVSMSRKEALVMECLMRNAANVCDKQAIIVNAWGFESETQDNNVEVYISFLRKKLKYLHSDCSIVTIRGMGYKLEKDHV